MSLSEVPLSVGIPSLHRKNEGMKNEKQVSKRHLSLEERGVAVQRWSTVLTTNLLAMDSRIEM